MKQFREEAKVAQQKMETVTQIQSDYEFLCDLLTDVISLRHQQFRILNTLKKDHSIQGLSIDDISIGSFCDENEKKILEEIKRLKRQLDENIDTLL